MKIIIVKDSKAMGSEAARLIARRMLQNPSLVLGLATGSTPIGTYQHLIRYCEEGLISFKKVKSFNLDEYVELDAKSPLSYVSFMQEQLFSKVDMDEKNWNIPDGNAQDLEKEALDYEEKIKKAGGIDLQLLGIGGNGHIGFNEPGTDFASVTHSTDLTEETIEDNARFFNSKEEVPTKAISMGMRSIMNAKEVLLLASGSSKAKAIKGAVQGPITTDVPASILQLHPNVTFIVDEEAARELRR